MTGSGHKVQKQGSRESARSPSRRHPAERAGRISLFSGASGIERLEAHLYGQAFSPHRHDTYAIGLTLSGVQCFHFRGERWFCLPGQCHILHPDERHDGMAGTEAGFSYRIIYIDPALVRDAIQARALPFVAQPVLDAATLVRSGVASLWNLEQTLDEIARVDLVVAATDLLGTAAAGTPGSNRLAIDGLYRVREFIAACPSRHTPVSELERIADLDRWTLARQFRQAFGTNPSRFRTLRRLDQVRSLLRQGFSLAQAATIAGFADQSHMSRRFKDAYGLTPGRWIAASLQSNSRKSISDFPSGIAAKPTR